MLTKRRGTLLHRAKNAAGQPFLVDHASDTFGTYVFLTSTQFPQNVRLCGSQSRSRGAAHDHLFKMLDIPILAASMCSAVTILYDVRGH